MPPQTNPQPQLDTMPRVKLNPFRHMWVGFTLLLKTNVLTVLGLAAIGFVIGLIGQFAWAFALAKLISGIFSGGSVGSSIIKIIGLSVVMLMVFVLIYSVVISAIVRAIIKGARQQKESLPGAFKIAFGRLGLAIRTNLMIFGIVLALYVPSLIAALVLKNALLAALLGLAAVICVIIFMFRVFFSAYVIVDDPAQPTAGSVIKRSRELVKRSTGAIVMYMLALFLLAIVGSVLLGSISGTKTSTSTYSGTCSSITPNSSSSFGSTSDNNSTIQYNTPSCDFQSVNSPSSTTVSKGALSISVIISLLVITVIQLIVSSGMAHIYDEAILALDGKMPSEPSSPGSNSGGIANPVAQSPVPPVPAAPSVNMTPADASPTNSMQPVVNVPAPPVQPMTPVNPIPQPTNESQAATTQPPTYNQQ